MITNCIVMCPEGACYCFDIYLPDGWITTAIFGFLGLFLLFRIVVYFIRTLPFT
jgi:hypothetical protein